MTAIIAIVVIEFPFYKVYEFLVTSIGWMDAKVLRFESFVIYAVAILLGPTPYLSFIVVITVALGVIVIVDSDVLPILETNARSTGYNASNGRCNPG